MVLTYCRSTMIKGLVCRRIEPHVIWINLRGRSHILNHKFITISSMFPILISLCIISSFAIFCSYASDILKEDFADFIQIVYYLVVLVLLALGPSL
jgi:hypothetical protein